MVVLVRAADDRQPVLLVLDDLHWADAPSLHWLGYLARRLDGLPLTVVAATRPPEQGHDPTLLDELLADPAAALVQPVPLALTSITELARERLGTDPADAFCAAVAVATSGRAGGRGGRRRGASPGQCAPREGTGAGRT